jgi:hypothetical protein
MAKEFRAPTSQDFEIVENGQVFGTLRVRPSGILWAPKGSHQWYRVSIEQFAEYAEKNGTKQKK